LGDHVAERAQERRLARTGAAGHEKVAVLATDKVEGRQELLRRSNVRRPRVMANFFGTLLVGEF
jgi:hypothetical protein